MNPIHNQFDRDQLGRPGQWFRDRLAESPYPPQNCRDRSLKLSPPLWHRLESIQTDPDARGDRSRLSQSAPASRGVDFGASAIYEHLRDSGVSRRELFDAVDSFKGDEEFAGPNYATFGKWAAPAEENLKFREAPVKIRVSDETWNRLERLAALFRVNWSVVARHLLAVSWFWCYSRRAWQMNPRGNARHLEWYAASLCNELGDRVAKLRKFGYLG